MVLGCQHPQGQAGVALQPEQPGDARPAGGTCKNMSRKALISAKRENSRNKQFPQKEINTLFSPVVSTVSWEVWIQCTQESSDG